MEKKKKFIHTYHIYLMIGEKKKRIEKMGDGKRIALGKRYKEKLYIYIYENVNEGI